MNNKVNYPLWGKGSTVIYQLFLKFLSIDPCSGSQTVYPSNSPAHYPGTTIPFYEFRFNSIPGITDISEYQRQALT